ncbi:MAG: TlpA family protein disulfide reductase [Proteobacteria bacterium]|nr:TlpA family protein disulfide reductase [Pseudomonadota bacterium]MCP4920187.1 TlpA family protein disulfide reductase [Pseudomonadota bacterium]
MGLVRSVLKSILTRVAERVAKNELFEKPGERAPTKPLEPDAKDEPEPPGRGFGGKLAPLCIPATTSVIATASTAAGRPLIVHHWATWCEPCDEELPLVQSLYQDIGERADVVGVSWDRFQDGGAVPRTVARVVAHKVRFGLTWRSLLATDEPDDFFEELGLDFQQIPQTLVFGADGDLVEHIQGAMDPATRDRVRDLVS